MKKIQVHCHGADGKQYIMNRLTGENMDAYKNSQQQKALKDRASKIAYEWSKVFPYDKFVVVVI